jgi:hypothetical protein
MGQVSFINGLMYAGYALELSLLVLLLSPKRIRRFPALCAYVASLFAVDLGRGWVLRHYPINGTVYNYSYYSSDLLLALGTFLLVCTFFRRACRDHETVWEFIRPILSLILVMVVILSAVALRMNFHFPHLFSRYIFEFNQDLYFVCLVLNTVLYVMLQRFKGASDLNLLVCGLGLQLAGPAIGSALASIMGSVAVLSYLSPFCSLTMMAIWIYAITRRQPTAYSEPGTPKAGGTGRRWSRSAEDSVSPAIGLKPTAVGDRSLRLVAGPSTLQAGYLKV